MTKLIAVTGAALALVLLAETRHAPKPGSATGPVPTAWTAQQQCIAVPMAADTT